MAIDALRSVSDENQTLVRLYLNIESGEDLKRIKQEVSPAAYIVRKDDLKRFADLKEIVEDRGDQKKSIELARLLIGRTRVPLVSSCYQTAGRVLAGVRKLLARADGNGDDNIYVIGVEEAIFLDLVKDHLEIEESGQPESGAKEGAYVKTSDDAGGVTSIVDLLSNVKVPEKLEKGYVGRGSEVQLVRKLIMCAALSRDPVLILGETGTGKEIVARAIHEYSGSAGGFVAVNCSAIPTELFESELFGAEKGAATDVKERVGLWEGAGKGTLFLDEINELAPLHQAKILRAIQERKARRLGANREISLEARLIAAGNKDLFALVKTGQFREDLYYRLRGMPIRTPALRDHREDIPRLAQYLWAKTTEGKRGPLPAEILSELERHGWPGNVRELKMALSSLHTLFLREREVDLKHLTAVFRLQGQSIGTGPGEQRPSEKEKQNAARIGYLRRVHEVIEVARIALKPLTEEPPPESAGVAELLPRIGRSLDELDMILHERPPRCSRSTYENVTKVHTALLFLVDNLKGNPQAAVVDYKADGTAVFRSAQDYIEREMRELFDLD